MADNENENKDSVLQKSTGLSTSFTISFEDEDDSDTFQQKRIPRSSNTFVRKHVRTLSLPFFKDYQFIKDDFAKCEGQYMVDRKYLQSVSSIEAVNQTVNEITSSTLKEYVCNQKESIESSKFENTATVKDNKCKETVSDSESGGTYTLDKDNKQIQLARKSIDQVFGISSNELHSSNDAAADEKLRSKTRMIDEWMEQSFTDIKSTNGIMWKTPPTTINCRMKNNRHCVSKIPFPVVTRHELNEATKVAKKLITPFVDKKKSSGTEKKPTKQLNMTNNGEIDTKCYLEETENIVTALQKRLHSNYKTYLTSEMKRRNNEPEKETYSSKYANTRFNRAFSLRRDRMKNSPTVINNTAIPVRTKTLTVPDSIKFKNNTCPRPQLDDRNNTPIGKVKKFSSPIGSPTKSGKQLTKIDNLKKKTYQRLKTNGTEVRSNSSLSAQEIEFQNWKRRKSYDPLKAAAEDKKKKSMINSTVGSSSTSTAVLYKKRKSSKSNDENGKSERAIMRSASFHGLRNKNGIDRNMLSDEDKMNRSVSSRYIWLSQSNENSVSSDIPDDDDEDEWIVPKPPSSSLQNTPPESVCSRLSLLSNVASSSRLLVASPVSKVNFSTLLNVTQLSQTIKTTISSLTDSLRENNESGIPEHQLRFQNENGLSRTHSPAKEIELSEINDVTAQINNIFYSENNLDEEKNSVQVEGNDNDYKYNEFMVDHQLRITLDNLRQIHVAVQELQLACSNK